MLVADQISFGYTDGTLLFDRFSLQVAPGERVALRAPSGFGKTTLCRLLAGYEKPQTGHISVDNEPLPKEGVSPVQLIGQHPELTLDPRLRMKQSLEESSLQFESVLEPLGIKSQWLARYPHELSGGELQRFCIARALLANPRYLIADEISTMLDMVTQAQIWHVLLDEVERKSMGLVFVSHSPELTKRIATRIIQLERF